VVRSAPRALCHRGMNSLYLLNRSVEGPSSRPGRVGEEKNIFPWQGIEIRHPSLLLVEPFEIMVSPNKKVLSVIDNSEVRLIAPSC
jgi:hypothetical protein